MQTVINYVTEHLDYFCIPLCALCVVRMFMCRLELRRSDHVRRTKGIIHAKSGHYAEIGLFAGILIGGLVTLLLGKLWLIGVPVMIVLGCVGWRQGRKKGLAADEEQLSQAHTPEDEPPALPPENEEPTERI